MRIILRIVLISLLLQEAEGQRPPVDIDYAKVRLSRVARAIPTDEKITIDGRLDEGVWSQAEPAKDFTQGGRSANPGHPSTQQTEVRFVYDTDNLYIGAICFEKDPSSMIVNGLKRDFPGGTLGDEIGVVLDSLNDDRTGFFFSTNPAGAKRDLQVSNDRQINQEWDGVWDVKVRIGDDRWVAEFIVPFKTLRFNSASSQTWGMNIIRKIRRVNEVSDWTPLPIRDISTRVSLAGSLVGIENIRRGRNLTVKPYVVAGVVQERSAGELKNNFDYDGGVDVKYGLTQSLTLDATYRTDFSQAEVDQDQVNLTRFNLFFPEKRDFFLENSGVFAFAGSGAAGAGGANLLPFFSRAIGLSPSGTPIPIIGGSRISGSIAGNEVGFLAMKTESEGNVPSNNFLVGRWKKNLLRNSYVGGIVTNRDATRKGDYNRVYGTDAVFQFWNKLDLSGYFLKSDTPGIDSKEDASKLTAGWRDDLLAFSADYEKVGDNFNPEVGFIRRDDMSHYSGDFTYTPRFDRSLLLRDMTFTAGYDYYAGVDRTIETRSNSFRYNLEFENSAMLSFNTNETFERLKEPFTRYSIPAGDYKFRDYTASFNSDRSRVIGGRINYTWGDFWNGTRKSAGGDVTFKPNYHWQIDTTYSRNDIRVPGGEFPTTLVGMKVLYAFSSRAFLNSFVQYNAERNQLSTNIRFNIIHRPLSDIYVVFNERRDTITRRVLDRGVIFKFTNLFNF